MTDTELAQRVKQIKFEQSRGFYLDAVELERDLFRDIAGEVHALYHEVQDGRVLEHCHHALVAHRELA